MALTDKLTAIADAIRGKTGKTDEMTLEQMVIEIGEIETQDVHFVTFVDADKELYVRPVADGDDCADVIARGLLDTPTKESDESYTYEFSGWSTTSGGSVGTDVFKCVTVDRTLYAVYRAIPKYTVRFWNESTLLQTVVVGYGEDATYTGDEPVKEGEYAFTGWSPEPTNVTADMDCYAQFRSTALVSKKLVERTISGDYTSDRVESIRDYAFYNCSALTTADFPAATSIGSYAFSNCSALASVNIPNVTVAGVGVFTNCETLTSVVFPNLGYGSSSLFHGCSALLSADFSSVSTFDIGVFRNCSALTTLILRRQYMTELFNTSAFTGTPIASGTGYIYVPSALVDTYKSATNWSTYAAQIRAIEDYPDICGGEA